MNARVVVSCAIVQSVVAAIARADVDPNSGIDFVRVGAVGNAPWAGNGTAGDRAIGRGGVNYEYSIGRFEVTTAQWVEFFNAAYDRPANDQLPHLLPPSFWGATPATPNTPGGRRWSVPAGNEMLPVGNISWRMAAMYCNYLHNGRATNRESFLNGAYDVSTFGYQGASGIFTDQLAHNPGARYWIPTWDEWLKSAHYDPSKQNPDGSTGGWWRYSNGSDIQLAYGPPGQFVNGQPAQANAGWSEFGFPGFSPFQVPLGAYATVSPWGLYDVAGGTSEWTEQAGLVAGMWPTARFFDGSAWDFSGSILADMASVVGGDFPSLSTYDLGFRIASSVPSPSAFVLGGVWGAIISARRRRTCKPGSHALARAGDRNRFRVPSGLAAVAGLTLAATFARADIDPNSGIDFARVGAVGNAPYQSTNPLDQVHNRGGVGYEYSIGRTEVPSAVWCEFFNAAYDRPAGDSIPFLLTPQFWGAVPTAPTTTGNPNARRWRVPTGNEMIPTGDITWRTAAILCNWLQNDKRTDRAAFMNGAYDVSTFGFESGMRFTDQQAHSPGARYWIPTWDEWLKAAHYDPNKLNGDGTRGGWWQYSKGSDTPYVYGPPGTVVNGQLAQANAGFLSPSPFSIPLGAYPTVQSPWGLLDVAGGTYEWTESVRRLNDGTLYRVFDGSARGDDSQEARFLDLIRERGDEFPHIADFANGLRLASSIPAPGGCVVGAGALMFCGARRRRG